MKGRLRRLTFMVLLACILAAGGALWLWRALLPPALPVPGRLGDTAFVDVLVVNPGSSRAPHQSIRVRGNRIFSVADTTAPSSEGPAAAGERPEYRGLVAVPGLIDMHVHYPPRIAVGNAELWSLLFLAHGVTTVRETGSIDGSIFAVRDGIRSGRRIGPRIFAAGAMLDGEAPSFPSNRVVRTPADGRAAVRDQAQRGADCIKVYNMLTPDVLAAIRDEATRLGLPVIGHSPHAVPFSDTGIDDVQHFTGVAVVGPETRRLRTDHSPADWRSVDAARIAEITRASLDRGMAHTPTLVNPRLRTFLVDPTGSERDTGLRHLPAFWVPVWRTVWGQPYAPGEDAEHTAWRRKMKQTTLALHRAGVPIHAGTDTLMPYVAPGSSLHGELAELVDAGLSVEEAWATATRVPGTFLREEKLGTIQAGAPADFLLFREDPTVDLAALGTLEAVVADGRLYTKAALDADLGRFDAHFLGPFYTRVLGSLANAIQARYAPERTASEH